MRNFKLSDDISFRFSNKNWTEYPLTSEKFVNWLEKTNPREEVINLFLSYESFGERQPEESGIFKFLEALPKKVIESKNLRFATPSEVVDELQPVSSVHVSHPISWADEERDLTAWLGNGMQKEAFEKLYNLRGRMARCNDTELNKDWNYLQVSDHLYYMSTKYLSDGEIHSYFNPFDTPYEAFINYMNVLSDFKIRLNSFVAENEMENELAALHKIIEEKEEKIKKMEANIIRLQNGKKRK
jgi:alpha-amylase